MIQTAVLKVIKLLPWIRIKEVYNIYDILLENYKNLFNDILIYLEITEKNINNFNYLNNKVEFGFIIILFRGCMIVYKTVDTDNLLYNILDIKATYPKCTKCKIQFDQNSVILFANMSHYSYCENCFLSR